MLGQQGRHPGPCACVRDTSTASQHPRPQPSAAAPLRFLAHLCEAAHPGRVCWVAVRHTKLKQKRPAGVAALVCGGRRFQCWGRGSSGGDGGGSALGAAPGAWPPAAQQQSTHLAGMRREPASAPGVMATSNSWLRSMPCGKESATCGGRSNSDRSAWAAGAGFKQVTRGTGVPCGRGPAMAAPAAQRTAFARGFGCGQEREASSAACHAEATHRQPPGAAHRPQVAEARTRTGNTQPTAHGSSPKPHPWPAGSARHAWRSAGCAASRRASRRAAPPSSVG